MENSGDQGVSEKSVKNLINPQICVPMCMKCDVKVRVGV